MILVDDREGSKELAPLIPNSVLVRLEYGDVCFQGCGPKGQVNIGIERKTIGDLINSISSGRLSGHQLPGLLKEYFKVYILVEGEWTRHTKTDVIMVPRWHDRKKVFQPLAYGKRIFKYRDVWAYLNSLQVMVGVVVRMANNASETARVVGDLYTWWQKPWEKHHAHVALYCTPAPFVTFNPNGPSLLVRIAAQLPGIGYERAKAVADYFKTVDAMMGASEKEWQCVEGIGKVVSKNVWRAIHK